MADWTRTQQIRQRCEAATVAPWIVDKVKNIGENWTLGSLIDCGSAEDGKKFSNFIVTTDGVHASELNGADALDDANFIANARQDIPWLLDEIKRQHDALNAIAAGDVEDPQRYAQAVLLDGATAELGQTFVDATAPSIQRDTQREVGHKTPPPTPGGQSKPDSGPPFHDWEENGQAGSPPASVEGETK